MPLEVSTILLAIAGDTLQEYATPLILLILPGSTKSTGRILLITGQEKKTSPPPSGAIPLLIIFNSRFSSFTIKHFKTGKEESLIASTCKGKKKYFENEQQKFLFIY